MVLTPDFSVFTEVFTETWTLGTEWLVPLALTIVVMAFITKDLEKWKVMALPLMILERILGIPVHFLLMAFAGIMFVVEALSTQVVGELMGTAKKWIKGGDKQGIGMSRDSIVRGQFETARQKEISRNMTIGKVKGFIGLPKKEGSKEWMDAIKRREELLRKMGLQK